MTTTTQSRSDTDRERVVAQIIRAIEDGPGAWRKTWVAMSHGAVNVKSKRRYRGINAFVLGAMESAGMVGPWGTYKQWGELGAQVRRGEKGTTVVLYKTFEKDEENADTGKTETRRIPLMRTFTVFAASQVDGYETPTMAPRHTDGRHDAFDAAAAAYGVEIVHGGGRACYSPTDDVVRMPAFESFDSGGAYYAVLAHELTHSTGHASRLDRIASTMFGSPEYALEELVAELGAAFLMAEFGIDAEPRADHAAYLASWLKAARDDASAIFKAASAASRAVDLILAGAAGAAADETVEAVAA